MKKTMYRFSLFSLFVLLVMTGCKKMKKYEIFSFSVSRTGADLQFTFETKKTAEFYEVSYYIKGEGSEPENGTKFTTTEGSGFKKSMESIDYKISKDYVFYIRAYKTEGKPGPWSGEYVLNAGPHCQAPYDLVLLQLGPLVELKWDDYYNNPQSTYFQVEYGISGFEQGKGASVNTSSKNTDDISLEGGNLYDFYVRGYCDATLGFSEWAGPYTQFVEDDYNLCSTPSGLNWTVETNWFGDVIGANFTWDRNGETEFEFVIVTDGASPDVGSIYEWDELAATPTVTIDLYTHLDFYVRAVCSSEARTAWAGPLNVYLTE